MIEQVNIAELPSLPLSERDSLPDCPAIYFALGKSGEVLYIGRATSLTDRWRAHHRERQLSSVEGVRIAWLLVDDSLLLPEIEQALIQHFEPTLNWTETPPTVNGMHTVAFRIPSWALSYYQELAAKERRKLSQVLRIVLEDHAKGRLDDDRGGRRQRAA